MKELLDMFLTFARIGGFTFALSQRLYLRRRICDAADAAERGSQWTPLGDG